MHGVITPERAKQIKLWILIPSRELRCLSPHHIAMLNFLHEHGIHCILRTLPGDSLVTRARNNLADIFLHESTDDNNHFSLWLDDDITFEPPAILQLLACDLDFNSAPYTRKGIHLDRTAAAASIGWPSERILHASGSPNVNWLVHPLDIREPMPVLESGSGFWLVKRKVFRMMSEALPIRYHRTPDESSHYGRDYAYDFFRVGVWPETKEYLSEDWWFCREWRCLGGLVHCCFWIVTHHIGPHFYCMDMPAIAELLDQTKGYINGPTYGDTGSHKPNGRDTEVTSDQAAGSGGTSSLGR